VQSISRLHHILRTAYALFCGRFMFNGTVPSKSFPLLPRTRFNASSLPGSSCAIR
jgi:hypothetical protein